MFQQDQLVVNKEAQKDKGEYAVVYLGGYGKSAQIYTKDTGIHCVVIVVCGPMYCVVCIM